MNKKSLKHSFIYIILLFSFLLTACATHNITRETSLDKDEGILIAKIHSNSTPFFFMMYDADRSGFPIADFRIENPEHLTVIPISARDSLYLRLMNRQLYYAEVREMLFKIEQQVATYVGDIFIEWTDGFWGGNVSMQILDRESETMAEVREQYPWLFDKYEYRKKIPVRNIEIVDKFEEVDELKKLKEEFKDNEKK
ncbi:MAG: hypothetical protein JSV21_09385 [Nitrospirota bacterium]|nr:MAG: hypothetical protein JSV21_09385 [Nitrospirota bacterium]